MVAKAETCAHSIFPLLLTQPPGTAILQKPHSPDAVLPCKSSHPCLVAWFLFTFLVWMAAPAPFLWTVFQSSHFLSQYRQNNKYSRTQLQEIYPWTQEDVMLWFTFSHSLLLDCIYLWYPFVRMASNIIQQTLCLTTSSQPAFTHIHACTFRWILQWLRALENELKYNRSFKLEEKLPLLKRTGSQTLHKALTGDSKRGKNEMYWEVGFLNEACYKW